MYNMLRALASIITLSALLCLLTLALLFSFSATIQPVPTITPHDISKLKKTIAKSNPFAFQRYKHQALVFDEKLLNQSANFALSQLNETSVAIKLQKNLAQAKGSIKLAVDQFTLYLNFSANITPDENLIAVSNIQLGKLPIPEWIVSYFTPRLMNYTAEQYPEYVNLLEAISKIDISTNTLVINYHWDRGLSKKLKIAGRNFLLPAEQQQLLGVYYQALGNLSRLYFWQPLDLSKIIGPIFDIARQRTEHGANPVKENEAAFLALGIMASGIRANHLLSDDSSKSFRNAYFLRLTLLKRRDLMQHFLISAALTVSTNKTLSDTIGLSKEMDDSEGKSGFSFADLLADRAGVKLAQLATQSESSARTTQQFLSQANLKESDFMPSHDNLPESISALQFKNRYIDIHNQKYLFVENELQRRIASRAVYRSD